MEQVVFYKNLNFILTKLLLHKSGIYSIFNFCNRKRYIPLKETAVPIEKSSELLSGNIGENPTVEDNTEINLETKESKSSYSVEDETINRI